MGLMYKKNKELLQKIYEEEYLKAEEAQKKAALNREIERIKAKAKEDAKRKYTPRKERVKKVAKKTGKKVQAARKKAKPYKKKLKRFSDNIQEANRDILGFDF